jgi:hypothetical protein
MLADAPRVMAKATRSNGSGREIIVQADVSKEDEVKQMFATAIEKFVVARARDVSEWRNDALSR